MLSALELGRMLLRNVDAVGDCWLWTGAVQTSGYGSISIGGRNHSGLVHRVAYEIWKGPLGELTADHRCQQRLCFNPEHLVAVPLEVNAARGRGSSPLYCVRGHPMFGTLGHWKWKGPRRRCMACHALRQRKDHDGTDLRGKRRVSPGQ